MPASLYSINLYDVLFMQKVYKKAKVPLTFLTLIKVFYTLVTCLHDIVLTF